MFAVAPGQHHYGGGTRAAHFAKYHGVGHKLKRPAMEPLKGKYTIYLTTFPVNFPDLLRFLSVLVQKLDPGGLGGA